MAETPIEVHIIADSTGDTAARVARAAAAQYVGYDVRIIRHPRQSTAEGLHDAFARMHPDRARTVVFSTVVDEGLRQLVRQLCAERSLPHADLLEQAVGALRDATGQDPERVVRPVGVSEDYFKRVQAMEFSIANDDGHLQNQLREADIVLIGVSRSGKTPLSMYLGYLGYKTANIPLVPGIPVPQDLYSVQRWKIVGLTIDPERLAEIREERVRSMGAPRKRYADLEAVFEELEAASRVHRRLRCPVIDVSELSVEETAMRIIRLVAERARRRETVRT